MSSIKILNHGIDYKENERLIYFSPIQLNSEQTEILNLYDKTANAIDTNISITNTNISASTYRRFISEINSSIVNINFDYGEKRNLSIEVDSSSGFSVENVVYLNITSTTDDNDMYKLNDMAFIINSIDGNVLNLTLHYDITDDNVDSYEDATSIVGSVHKPVYNFTDTYSISTLDLYELTNSETIDLQLFFEFLIESVSNGNETNQYNGVLVYSNEIISSQNEILDEDVIYNFTENGYLFKDGISIFNSSFKEGSLKPALLISFDETEDFSDNHKFNINSTISDDNFSTPEQATYDGYIGNFIRMAENLVNKGLGDIYESILDLDLKQNIIGQNTVDYERIENYIDDSISSKNINNEFDYIIVDEYMKLNDMKLISDNNDVIFKFIDGSFKIGLDTRNIGYDKIIFDNDSIVDFKDNVNINNQFNIYYSSYTEENRLRQLLETQMGFIKIKLGDNTTDSIHGNKIKNFFTISTDEDIDNRIMFSSYLWHNNDISGLGYFSHKSVNNLLTFNNFLSGRMTSVVTSQNLERIGLISQEDIYIYANKNIKTYSKNISLSSSDNLEFESNNITFKGNNINLLVDSEDDKSVVNLNVNTLSAKNIDVEELSIKNNGTIYTNGGDILTNHGNIDLQDGSIYGKVGNFEHGVFVGTGNISTSDGMVKGSNGYFTNGIKTGPDSSTYYYTKILTGTTDGDNTTLVTHGLNYDNIVGINVLIKNSDINNNYYYPPTFDGSTSDLNYYIYIEDTYISIVNVATKFQSQPYRILITYI